MRFSDVRWGGRGPSSLNPFFTTERRHWASLVAEVGMGAVRTTLLGLAALSLAATLGLATARRPHRDADPAVFHLALDIARPDTMPAAPSPRLIPAAEPADRVERTGS
jgi:hypothetical protein